MQLDVKNVSHSYGTDWALDDVSFTLNSGLNILLGANGAGKSTLFSLMTGLTKLSKGNITYSGKTLSKDRQHVLSRLGVVFQQNTLDLDLTIKQNIAYFASLHGLSTRTALSNIDSVLHQLALSSRLNDKVRNLNGGHRRRVELARSLIHQPQYLLFDEPTVGLDIDSRKLILSFVHNYVNTTKCLVLWATHLLEEVSPNDNVLVMASGRLIDMDTCENLLQAHQANSVDALFRKLTQAKAK